jgi:hypothetical protein
MFLLFLLSNKALKYSTASRSLIPYYNIFYNYPTQREKAIKIAKEVARRTDSLKELELKVPHRFHNIYTYSFTFTYFYCSMLLLPSD